jgi:signal transduction histidine kinase
MSKKKLPNLLDRRLDSLLTDLENEAAYLPSQIEKPLAGWAWACNSQCRYISCDAEVEAYLDIPSEDFPGKLLSEYALHPDSQNPVESAVREGIFPTEVRVTFLDKSGKPVPALLQFLSPSVEDSAAGTIRGFVHLGVYIQDLQADQRPGVDDKTVDEAVHEETPGSASPADLLSHLAQTSLDSLGQDSLLTITSEEESPTVMAVPLRLPNKSIGLLEVIDDNPDRYWSADERKLVEQVADQLSQALETAYLYQETHQRVQELDLLFGVSQSLSVASMNQAEISMIAAESLAEVMEAPDISLLLLDAGQNAWKVLADFKQISDAAGNNSLVSTERSGTMISFSEFPDLKELLSNLKPVESHYSDREKLKGIHKYMQMSNRKFILFLPLAVQGQLTGIIEIGTNAEGYSYTSSQFNLAAAVVNAAAVALENARLYEEQRKVTEKLREVDKLKSQFLANMSHELRTPLNSIIGFSRVILKGIDGPITELQQQDLNAIHTSGTHLLNLINNVLDISKIEAGRMELIFEDDADICILIDNVVATTQALVKDKPVLIEKHVQPDLPLLRMDTTRVRQVLLNLLSNAVKFTEKGNIELDAYMQIGEDGQAEVMVKVTDTGIGIAPENQFRLFQPFSQVDESLTRKAGGSGLGLSISRLLVELHGGRIGVSSEVGAGSTFFFTLPIQEETQQKV